MQDGSHLARDGWLLFVTRLIENVCLRAALGGAGAVPGFVRGCETGKLGCC